MQPLYPFRGRGTCANTCSNNKKKYIYIYIYIYIYAVKSVIGPSLAIFKVNNWAKSKSITGPRSFSHYTNRGLRRFLGSVIIVFVFFGSQLSGSFLKIAFFKKRVQKSGFPIFCVLSLKFEKSLFLGLLKHYKNRCFS